MKSCDAKHQIKFIKYQILWNESGGANFENENKITLLEYAYQEIDLVLIGKEPSGIKKSELDQKSSRREGDKKESTLTHSLTKPNNRQRGGNWKGKEGDEKYIPLPMYR